MCTLDLDFNKYNCKLCNYNSSRKSDYDRHILTRKHLNAENTPLDIKSTNSKFIVCKCGKQYKHQSSYSKHKKKCVLNVIGTEISTNEDSSLDTNNLKSLVLDLINENNNIRNLLIRENQELRNQITQQTQQITEMIPKIGINANIKQRFNINVFLNEKCKDAINLNDFVKTIDISLKQLDITRERGLFEGLSAAIIENMSKLSLFQRPVHCTDIKRETIYIKDHDNWERDYDKTKIKDAIKKISTKQYITLKQWMGENPDFKDNDKKQHYITNMLSTIGSDTSYIDEKIIKKLCNNIYIK